MTDVGHIIFRGHSGIIRAMATKGAYVFSGAADHSIKVWDIKDKDLRNSRGCIATLAEHSGDVWIFLIKTSKFASMQGRKISVLKFKFSSP